MHCRSLPECRSRGLKPAVDTAGKLTDMCALEDAEDRVIICAAEGEIFLPFAMVS